MTVQKQASFRKAPAALSVPSKSLAYRFSLSVCFLALILFSLTFHHAQVGIFILALLNLVFCADVLVRCAWADLCRGKFSLAAVVAGGAFAGFLYSAFNTFLSTPLTGPVPELYLYVSLLITLGLWAQQRVVLQKEKARVFIKKVDDFLPKSGRLCVGRQFSKRFATELKKGDLIFVKPGERLPADGVVKKGKTSIDEQLITGNMLPTSKTVGSRVYAGTLNKSAEIYVEVTEVLSASALMSVLNAIKTGEVHRSEGKDYLDGASAWLVPLVWLIAAGGYAAALFLQGTAHWFRDGGVFLFVLSLGTPLAFLFSAAFPAFFAKRGAQAIHIKIQNLHVLEELVQADTVFFDKTGTLTYGTLSVSGVYPQRRVRETELLEVLATAEQLVDGPFAEAVNTYARERKVQVRPLLCFDVLPGLGVQAVCGGKKIVAGRAQWLAEQGIALPGKITAAAEAVICVAQDGRYLGYLTLSDALRPGAKEVVSFLKARGKDVILMSGDNEASVAAVARETGIEKWNAGVLPKTKAEIVTNLRALGKRVVMVGDGFNDIIALLRADGGVVFYSGRNVYNNWVDVIIKRRDLYPLVYLFTINRKLRRITRQNVWLALAAHGVLIAGLFRVPAAWQVSVYGALAAVVLVLLNSIRMLKIK